MTAFKNSKADELNPTQDFKGGFVNLPFYTQVEIDALTPAANEYPLVFNTTTTKLNFWNGTAWANVTSA